MDKTLSEAQSGFRKGRSVQDHIFTIKQIIERKKRNGEKIFLAFMDLTKAFDSVPRESLKNCLVKRGINTMLINAIMSLYNNTVNYVIWRGLKSETFKTTEGLRQGGGLSPTLFNIFIDDIIRKCNSTTKKIFVGYRQLRRITISECAFADDIVLVAPSEQSLQDNLIKWNHELKINNMKLNITKTKVMVIADKPQELNIRLDDTLIQHISEYKYLGVLFDSTGTQEKDLSNRIRNTFKLYFAVNKTFIAKKEISVKTKINVYKAIYRPTLTYGCETWVLNKKQRNKLQAVEMKYLRRTKGLTIMDKIRNNQIRDELQLESLQEFIDKRQLSWWGHLQRMGEKGKLSKCGKQRNMEKRRGADQMRHGIWV